MMGFPRPDEPPASVTLSAAPFRGESAAACLLPVIPNTRMHFLYACPNFSTTFSSSLILSSSSSSFFFLLLNSSLFSSHVYFYPSVPREESEKWRGLGRLAHLHGNYILQKKPSLSDVAYASALYTFCRPYLIITFVQAPYFTASPLSTCSVELPLFFFFFFFFSLPMHASSPGSLHAVHPSAAPSPPPLPGADWAVFSSLNQWACCCRVILYKPTPRSWDTVRDAVRFAATVRPTSMRLKKILCGLCSVQGGFPISPTPPLFTGSCWEMQIYWHPPQSITAGWHPLLKHMLYYWTCMWFD